MLRALPRAESAWLTRLLLLLDWQVTADVDRVVVQKDVERELRRSGAKGPCLIGVHDFWGALEAVRDVEGGGADEGGNLSD